MKYETKTITCIVAMIWGVLVLALPAATYTWDGGGGDNHWGTLANWDPDLSGVGDLTGADLVFSTTAGSAGGSATTPSVANNDQAGVSINSLTFSGFSGSNWVLNGSSVSVGAGGITVTISTSGRSVTISNDVSVSAGHAWTGSANSPLTIAGNLSGSADVTVNAALDRWILSGSNALFTGTISGNRLTLLKNISMVGGHIELAAERLTLSGASSAGLYTFGLGNGNGNVSLTSSAYVRSKGDGVVQWDPGQGGDFVMNTNLQLAINGDFKIGNVTSKIVVTGGNRQVNTDNTSGPVVEFLGALSDDGVARTLTCGSSRSLIILTRPRSGGNGGGSIVGRFAISNMNQIFSGNLDNTAAPIVLDNVSWADFRANRSSGFGSGASQFKGLNFAARTVPLVIDSAPGGFSFNANFTIGCAFKRYGASEYYANQPVIITLDTTLTAVRTITVESEGASVEANPAYGVIHRITGSFSDDDVTRGSLYISGSSGDTRIGEIVFAGANNTWHGAASRQITVWLSTGRGGLMSSGGIIHFDDTGLGDGETSFPHGNGGSLAYIATLANNDSSKGGNPNRGFLIAGSAVGRTYTLPAGMKFLIGDLENGNMSQGVFGSSGSNATLSASDILIHSEAAGDAQYLGLYVRSGLLTLGDAGGPVRLQRTANSGSMPGADPGVDSTATVLNDAVSTTTNGRLLKMGIGTLALGNLRYTLQDGSGDVSAQYRWTLNDGAVRETANTISNSLSANTNLGVTTMAGGVIEIGHANDFTQRLGSLTGQLDMSGGGGFAAYGGRRIVRLTKSDGTLGGSLVFSAGDFVDLTAQLIFGSTTADNTVEFQNNFSGGGGSGVEIGVIRGVGSVPEVDITGAISVTDPLQIVAVQTPWGTALPAGTLVLSGTSTYNENTLVEAGTLLVNGTLSTRAVNVTVYSGATLGGTGVINRAVIVQSGGILAPGNLNSVGTLTVNGDLTMAEGSALNWNGAAGANDGVEVSGTVTLPSAMTVNVSGTGQFASPTLLFDAGALAGAANLSGWTVTGSPGATVAIDGTTVMLVAENEGTIFFIQ